VGSGSELGSPFAGSAGWPGSQQAEEEEKKQNAEEGKQAAEKQAGSTEQGGEQQRGSEQRERLEPVGRPMHRVKSRRQVGVDWGTRV
jgi:hypothetical protein